LKETEDVEYELKRHKSTNKKDKDKDKEDGGKEKKKSRKDKSEKEKDKDKKHKHHHHHHHSSFLFPSILALPSINGAHHPLPSSLPTLLTHALAFPSTCMHPCTPF
jgi:cation transport ATPase